ncbi:uncharacterized protein FTOL_06604 [Fusarium torulosum]|uniref:ABC transporter domain-containing protein n=1 Tax=Fusarium torulosum TaxID=33205 RepID=A0AAE8MAC8_9HYPO|nr:uncharacterized protein FTOL_06604 [Fusarium torulosum]
MLQGEVPCPRRKAALDLDIQEMKKGDQNPVASRGTNLSGGERQRLALARAVYSRRRIMIMDDVFSGMDAHTAEFVSRQLLGKRGLLRRQGTTVILATHSEDLMALADVLIILNGERIDGIGSPEALRLEGYLVHHDREHLQNDNVKETEQGQVESSSNQESPSLEQLLKPKLIVSSVDTMTESLMQNIIETDFQKCTVISVMHRLVHVTKYDKLALLDSWGLVAFDTSPKLLSSGRRMEDLYKLEGDE